MKNNQVVLVVLFIFFGTVVLGFLNFDVLMQNHTICPFAALDCEHGISSLFGLNEHLSSMQYLTSLILSQSIYVFALLLLGVLFFSFSLFGLGNELLQRRPILKRAEQKSVLLQRRLLKWLVLRERRESVLANRALITDLGGP